MAFRPTSISKMFSSPALPLTLDYSLSSSLFARSSRQRLLVSRRSLSSNQKWRHSMFVGAKPVLKDGTLSFSGQDVLKGVPANIVLTPLTDSSAYVGATSTHTSSRHVFKIGVIEDVRLLCLFRFKIWWMIPKVGTSGSDIPIETQMLLLESRQGEASEAPTSYIVFLPLLDGKFRSSLQGNSSNELEICVESGDPTIVTSQSLKAVFMNYGEHPFDLMKESMKILVEQTGTFALRETKQIPGMLDWFGWCTWDAFYHDVNPQGIIDGLTSLSEGGTPARFLIIDDGWQDTTNEFQKEGDQYIEGSQFGGRLVSIEENSKFRKTADGAPSSLKDFVSDIKKTFGLKYVYVWHALMGYWGGLLPGAAKTMKYNPKLRYPVQSPGNFNLANTRDISMDSMEKYGVGAIDPAKISHFYQDLHRYLASQNVDGVKVDVQNILETIATDQGGRVSLTRQFQEALENSIDANFKDNSIICCMALSMDSIYQYVAQLKPFDPNLWRSLVFLAKRSAITRASDDYYPENPATQTLHIAAVSFNSIFLGEVVIPDWDMFYSHHDAAEFHAVARAVGGCGVYVSDKPGHHDFKILRRLVLPDGSILRAKYPGRPARDCLFCDPVMDGKSLLKIWNLNKCTGVIGVFNCQGAGSWPCWENTVQEEVTSKISGQVSPADIEYFEEVSGRQWTGDCAVFSFSSGSLFRLPLEESFHVALKSMECDVFTVSPIKVYNQEIQFAPIGLLNMYNSGGAVESVDYLNGSHVGGIHIKGRGGGTFGAYSSIKPQSCSVNSKDQGFNFNAEEHLLVVTIPNITTCWDIHLCY